MPMADYWSKVLTVDDMYVATNRDDRGFNWARMVYNIAFSVADKYILSSHNLLTLWVKIGNFVDHYAELYKHYKLCGEFNEDLGLDIYIQEQELPHTRRIFVKFPWVDPDDKRYTEEVRECARKRAEKFGLNYQKG